MKLYKLMLIGLLVVLCFSTTACADPDVSVNETDWGNPSVNITPNSTVVENVTPVMPEKSAHELQKSIDDTPDGGVLYLNSTLYRLDSPIIINKTITIIGSSENDNGFSIVDGQNKTNLFELFNGATVTFKNINFTDAKGNAGGAAISDKKNAKIYVEDCNFNHCVSNGNGGAISSKKYVSAKNSTFLSCEASNGGALYVDNQFASGDVDGCYFEKNYAWPLGGAILGYNLAIRNSVFYNNTGAIDAGAIDAMSIKELVNCTFIENNCLYGTVAAVTLPKHFRPFGCG